MDWSSPYNKQISQCYTSVHYEWNETYDDFLWRLSAESFTLKNYGFEHLENILKDEENIWMFENFAKEVRLKSEEMMFI
jgi:hypothetical protein